MYWRIRLVDQWLIPCDLTIPKVVAVEKVFTCLFTLPRTWMIGSGALACTCGCTRRLSSPDLLVEICFKPVLVQDNDARYAMILGAVYGLAAKSIPGGLLGTSFP